MCFAASYKKGVEYLIHDIAKDHLGKPIILLRFLDEEMVECQECHRGEPLLKSKQNYTHRIKDDRMENYGAYIGFISK